MILGGNQEAVRSYVMMLPVNCNIVFSVFLSFASEQTPDLIS